MEVLRAKLDLIFAHNEVWRMRGTPFMMVCSWMAGAPSADTSENGRV